MVQVVKPAIVAALNVPEPVNDTVVNDTLSNDTTIRDTVQPKARHVMFIGSSTIGKWDIDKSFPELDSNWVKAAYPGYKWSDIFYNIGDTVKSVMPRQLVIYSGDNDIVLKTPLLTMQNFFQRICKEKIWVHDTTIVITLMYTKPSNPTKAVVYDVKQADGSIIQESGWNVTKYFKTIKPGIAGLYSLISARCLTCDGTDVGAALCRKQFHPFRST